MAIEVDPLREVRDALTDFRLCVRFFVSLLGNSDSVHDMLQTCSLEDLLSPFGLRGGLFECFEGLVISCLSGLKDREPARPSDLVTEVDNKRGGLRGVQACFTTIIVRQVIGRHSGLVE